MNRVLVLGLLISICFIAGCSGNKIKSVDQTDIKELPRSVMYINEDVRQIVEELKASMTLNDSGTYDLFLWISNDFNLEDFTKQPIQNLNLVIKFLRSGRKVAELNLNFAEFYQDEDRCTENLTCVKRNLKLNEDYYGFFAEYIISSK